MTPAEFKAWFDGFTEAFSGCPTKAQWARIKERVSEIDGKPVTERVYVDRYWRDYHHWQPYWSAAGVGVCNTAGSATDVSSNTARYREAFAQNYNSISAMNALGKADAMSLAQ